MDKTEAEIRYLCVEANELLKFADKVSVDPKNTVIVPNLSYGLVAISPILPQLRSRGYKIHTTKIGSSEAHNNSMILGDKSLTFNLTPEVQPNFIVVDGTRNVGGDDRSNDKYPDSQQGFLNYTAIVDDVITSNADSSYKKLLGLSSRHIKALRETGEYLDQRRTVEQEIANRNLSVPYQFRYWNPAGLNLAIYNHGEFCSKTAESFSPEKQNAGIQPTVFFTSTGMPDKYHSREHRSQWGEHNIAYFDDNGTAKNFRFCYDTSGIFMTSGLGKIVQDTYQELFGGQNGKSQ